ncbi:hypothetical protein LMG23992_04232 [Cupriavidus laharis]|uniref:Uncharacterized protein n=2 Tax=Cupriavidus TaxID=106589 RepID=A0ABM8XJQ5_9BURK|nr:hypothetical protein LMG23992_04232 [Cupriavidus laharis]CAG9187548.1 hypothetical protein LMG23994_06993 [Cupriavidus pinatubonensis]
MIHRVEGPQSVKIAPLDRLSAAAGFLRRRAGQADHGGHAKRCLPKLRALLQRTAEAHAHLLH